MVEEMSAIQSVARAAVEGFADTAPNAKREVYADSVAVLLAFFFALFILAFVGKLLWNGVVVELFSFAKPARSFWQIIGLMIFINLIRP
jgi:hypothetical protein